MTTQTETWYGFVLQQMAAESYFEGIEANDAADVQRRLRLGNNRAEFVQSDGGAPGNTRFADIQIDASPACK
jgi:hypothetical protein